MKEIELKYGCNPNQKPARIYMEDGSELPVEVLNGRPGYINFMDALNPWQLVRALPRHGQARGCELQARLPGRSRTRIPAFRGGQARVLRGRRALPIATAYARARGADRLCSRGLGRPPTPATRPPQGFCCRRSRTA